MVIQDNNPNESMNELAITKAAAWAWYERGSWFENKSIRESDCRRKSEYIPRPSRYKLEAIKKRQKENRESQSRNNSSLLWTANSLLDVYEIERISRDLDCYVESSRIEHRRRSLDGGDHGSRRIGSFPEGVKSKKKSKSDRAKRKGFWFGHQVVCGTRRDDVVNSNLLVKGR